MTRAALIAPLLVAIAWPAMAQYKVVGSDGSVTYTDRPPAAGSGRITTLSRRGDAPATGDAGLPLELRQVIGRYPVTLYTAPDCNPCDSGRQLLLQRGVPFSERRVLTEDDSAALERVVGGRTVPSLTIGAQALRGLSQTDWTSYLDAAGYPRESQLPPNWQPPAATPMVERATPTVRAAATAASAAAPEPAPLPAPESAVRF
jgi:glutaredoxin